MSARTLAGGIALALAATWLAGCATPDAPRQERNASKQEELTQMERAGQRNDDRPIRIQ